MEFYGWDKIFNLEEDIGIVSIKQLIKQSSNLAKHTLKKVQLQSIPLLVQLVKFNSDQSPTYIKFKRQVVIDDNVAYMCYQL